MTLLLRSFALLGLLLFGGLLMLTFASPLQIEHQARDYLREQVEQRVGARLAEAPTLEKAASLLAGRYQAQIEATRQTLLEELSPRIEQLLGQMQQADCSCRQAPAADALPARLDWQAGLARMQERVTLLARSQYLQLVDGLLHELRVFSASNALAFLLMLIACLRRPASVQQALPAILLLVAVLVSSYFYLFQQNWFFSILFNDYLGYAYSAYLGLVYLLLCDLLLNRARVITWLVNGLLDAVGSSLEVAPCC